ncbi:MAG TPA: DUF4097 family beta strand repeat-containing protein [Thermoanaerobaculaceae bacterium]|nr:DUF4097 family beta strand repeat-containing protein [Thermoanaerobaculaceae bacterium]HPS78131.1 DUF4097 family beta strand repeat-containing protein [Thermoanaerobaculaceae bacterium]
MQKLLGVVLSLGVVTAAGAAEKREEISQAFPAPAGKVVLVDAGPLDLVVRIAEIPEIRVKVELVAGAFSAAAATAWVEAHRPVLQDSEQELRLSAPDPGGVKLFKGVVISRARVELVIPPGVRADLSTSSGNLQAEGEFGASHPLRLRASSGDIELLGWAPEVEARTTSGAILVRASRAIDRLLARSSSGDLVLAGGVHALRADTASGQVRAEGLLGGVAIVTSTGSVTVRFDALGKTDEISISSTSGRVRISLPPGAKPSGELVTSSGEIRSEHPGDADAKGMKVRLSGDGPKLSVSTTSGKIELT